MKTYRLPVMLILFGFFPISLCAVVPDISVLEDKAYPGGICYMASVGQLIHCSDDSSTVQELMAMSGFCSEYAWVQGLGGVWMVDPHAYIYNTRLRLYSGQSLDLYQLSGLVYHIGFLRGGGAGASIRAQAKSVTLFKSEAEAVNRLKQVLDNGQPVQVHLDFQYVADEAGVYYPFWRDWSGGSTSHFVIVHDYDDEYVYFADNDPTRADDVDEDGQKDGLRVPLRWDTFLDAWYNGGMINQKDKNIRFGPYYLFYLDKNWGPARASSLQILKHLSYRGQNGPDALYKAANAIESAPQNGPSVLSQNFRDRKAEMTALMAQWLDSAGYEDLADLYEQIADLWSSIRDNPDWNAVPDILRSIAALTEQFWQEAAELTDGMSWIALLEDSPDEKKDISGGTALFRWAQPLDWTTGAVLELAMKGDFSDRRSIVRFRARAHQTQMFVNKTMWLQALPKDDGDRKLSWRVVNGSNVSDTSVFEWEPLTVTLTAPADGFQNPPGYNLLFQWSAPAQAGPLRLVFCRDDQFTDRKLQTAIALPRNANYLILEPRILSKIKRFADAEGWIYCRIIDTKAGKTTVGPSEIIRIQLDAPSGPAG